MSAYIRCIALCALLLPTFSQAQSVEVSEEYSQRIKKAETVAPLGDNLFGESVNYYTGETTFSTTDVDLPGNDALPVRLTRRINATASNERIRPVFAGWDLDVPYLTGNFAASAGWIVSGTTPGNRCSGGFAPPPAAGSYRSWSPNVFWRGISMHANGGTQALLKSSPLPRPTDGVTSAFVTSQNWQIRCLSRLANSSAGYSGEGFLALAPDGTKYYFDWMTSPMTVSGLKRLRPPPPGATGSTLYFESLGRVEIRIYASKVVDRFGNTVTYTWSGDQLREIAGSDGRKITLSLNGNGTETATANGKVWTYTSGKVDLPDHTAWQYSGRLGTTVSYSDLPSNRPPCHSLGTWLSGPNQTQQMTIVHPSGAIGTFTSKLIRRGRTLVWNECSFDTQSPYNDTAYGPMMNSDNYALVSKTIAGPGLIPQTWTVSYSPVTGTIGGDLGGTPTPTPSDSERAVVTVTKPDSSSIRYVFGTRYFVDEGKLTRIQTFAANGAVVQDVQNSYALNPSNPPYARVAGGSGPAFADDFADVYRTPRTRTITYVNGDSFTNTVNSFDEFVREVSVTRNNSIGSSRTDVTSYYDNQDRWVLGQVKSKTNSDTGVTESAIDFDTTYDKPGKIYSFGLLQKSMKYNFDGTLSSVSNGSDETTTFSRWKRGVPQLIRFPDTKTQSAEVDDDGLIRSVTDELSNTITYDYDPAGRLSGMTWPARDTVAWAPKIITYIQLTSTELGFPTGSWRMRLNEGNHQRSVYYDARLNPVLTEEKDTATGATRYVFRRYDFDGRVTFESYPSTSSSPIAGITTTYDTLGRSRLIQTHDGVTLSKIDYLFGNRKQVMDASRNVTTTSYQGFDQPAYDKPLVIAAPESQTTSYNRNVFGEILSATRSGNGGYLAETNVYDSYHRLCKIMRPESGQRIVAFDAASRMTWSAAGTNVGTISSTDCSYSAVPDAEKTAYRYDKRGRVTLIDYADSSGDVTRDYDDAGHLTSVRNPTATLTYTYNKRGLIESQKLGLASSSSPKTLIMSTGYDALGHVANETFPDDSIVTYAPNAWGEDTRVGNFATITERHPTGAIRFASFQNGLNFSTTLDSRQRLESQIVGGLQSLIYRYNEDSQLVSVTDQIDGADSATFTYDGLHRLKTANGLWGNYTYGYDAIGNLRIRTGSNALTYDYDTSNRLSAVTGAALRSYTYDTRARVTSDGRLAFTWNLADQITGAPNKAFYAYDGNGKRVQTTLTANGAVEYAFYDIGGKLRFTQKGAVATTYVDMDGKPFVEVETTSTATTGGSTGGLLGGGGGGTSGGGLLGGLSGGASGGLLGGLSGGTSGGLLGGLSGGTTGGLLGGLSGGGSGGLLGGLTGGSTGGVTAGGPPPPRATTSNGTAVVRYLHADWLGSPRLATKADGTTLWREHFDPYGKKLNGAVEKRGFTGHAYDAETGMTYMLARYYDADVGRFLMTDPIGSKDDFNLYSYVKNNPLNSTDPTGTAECANSSCSKSIISSEIQKTSPVDSALKGNPNTSVVTVTFKNDTPGGPSTDKPVSSSTAVMVETTLKNSGVSSANINSSTGGVHDPKSLHGSGRAVDIDRVNGQRVSPSNSGAEAVQNAAANTANIRENFGPFMMEKTTSPGGAPSPVSNPSLTADHQGHIHLSGQE